MRIYSNIIDIYQLIFRSRSSTIIQVSAVSCLQGGRPGPLYFLLHLTPSLSVAQLAPCWPGLRQLQPAVSCRPQTSRKNLSSNPRTAQHSQPRTAISSDRAETYRGKGHLKMSCLIHKYNINLKTPFIVHINLFELKNSKHKRIINTS